MRFGLIYELQLPRPWGADSEHRMVQDALTEAEVADRLGFDYIWANEHHFLEEYSHNSAPEVFLAAAAGRTKQIHVGHAVVLSPPGYNPPARVAERIAMLDLVSSGRAEWGTGSSASRAELEGFNINTDLKKLMWAEATEQTANMMAMEPYPGFKGDYFSIFDAISQRHSQAVAEAASPALARLLQPRDDPRCRPQRRGRARLRLRRSRRGSEMGR
jgi:alkanesulfonate monooxygenase SsuD/methylene tetrahydromethanopterin reductase-like flavin-dependent oxidoreductase (luciferase family)